MATVFQNTYLLTVLTFFLIVPGFRAFLIASSDLQMKAIGTSFAHRSCHETH